MASFCTNCGSEVDGEFCTNCGQKMEPMQQDYQQEPAYGQQPMYGQQPVYTQQPVYAQPQKKSAAPTVLRIVACVLFVLYAIITTAVGYAYLSDEYTSQVLEYSVSWRVVFGFVNFGLAVAMIVLGVVTKKSKFMLLCMIPYIALLIFSVADVIYIEEIAEGEELLEMGFKAMAMEKGEFTRVGLYHAAGGQVMGTLASGWALFINFILLIVSTCIEASQKRNNY